MRRIGAVIAAVVLVLALTASTTLANPPGVTGTLDQRQIVFTAGSATWDSTVSLAQTFTAGMTGTLDAVGVYVGVTTPPPPTPPPGPAVQVQPAVLGDTRIEVWNTTGGLPSGPNAIASESLNLVGLAPGAVYFEIPSPPNVVAGTQYLILVEETGSDLLNWYGDCTSDNYTGGQALVFTSATHTWQTVPAW